ncbi:MAG: peptide chain release factor 3 [Rickettsiales bacterium]|nr:peptide chain release factor 3 [Rickettsiales bacterium]
MDPSAEAARRRTFAIISHPDAGKTTLTEKLLLYSGAIHLAGSVRARKASRHAVSDWMKMEQERGISITSSVLQFDYLGSALNLVDTPGHADFSEDTYRTLAAVDSAVMLMDHTKGVESRTRKLFEVCRMRQLPVITFMNKLDRPGLDPLDLIDEVSSTLNLRVTPLNWPIGMGSEFRGVVDLLDKTVLLYDSRGNHGQEVAEEQRIPLDEVGDRLEPELLDQVHEELELLEGAGDPWSIDDFLAGRLSPIFWGSAMSNFGVRPLLDFVARNAAAPSPRKAHTDTAESTMVSPDNADFSGFVFKIQANMNPRHRDRVAFLRVVSGRFRRGMDARIGRSGANLRLTEPHTFMADERAIVSEAWAGDIVGMYDPGKLRIGDTLSSGEVLRFDGIPRFAPEHFARAVLEDPMKRKQLDAGLDQLSHEGVIQLFFRPGHGRQDPWLGAVGLLQFEVLKERLKAEYKVPARLEPAPYKLARWVRGSDDALAALALNNNLCVDRNNHPVVLAESSWAVDYASRSIAGLELFDVEPL